MTLGSAAIFSQITCCPPLPRSARPLKSFLSSKTGTASATTTARLSWPGLKILTIIGNLCGRNTVIGSIGCGNIISWPVPAPSGPAVITSGRSSCPKKGSRAATNLSAKAIFTQRGLCQPGSRLLSTPLPIPIAKKSALYAPSPLKGEGFSRLAVLPSFILPYS